MNSYGIFYSYRRELHTPRYVEEYMDVDAETAADALTIAAVRAVSWGKDLHYRVTSIEAVQRRVPATERD